MATYSVLLEKWSMLPHLQLGEGISAILGIHLQTVYTRLRIQQGIVEEKLDLERAETLAKFLADSGYPSIVLDDSEVFDPGKVIQCRNADVIDGEIRIEDPYENLTRLDIGRLTFLHVGWVEELEKASDNRKQYFGKIIGTYEGYVESSSVPVKEPRASIGWVLHIFSGEFGNDCLRICYNRFNYDYQELKDEPREKKFRRLLYDLKSLIPGDKLDESFMAALMCGGEIPENLKYKDIDALMKRIIWQRTLALRKA
jgi:hypothetical protein